MKAIVLTWAVFSFLDAYHEWYPRMMLSRLDVSLYAYNSDGLSEVGVPSLSEGIVRRLYGAAPYDAIYAVSAQGDRIGDADIARVASFPHVVDLYLKRTSVTDDGIAVISSLPTIRYLQLEGERITDKGLRVVSKVMSLESLILTGTQVTDHGVALLAGLPVLNHLGLQDTRITDAVVESLLQMKELESVDLCGTAITKQGVSRLRTRPGLHVFCDSNLDADVTSNPDQ